MPQAVSAPSVRRRAPLYRLHLHADAEPCLRLLLPLTFFLLGLLLLPWPGLQNDEALFSSSLYGAGGTAYHVLVLKHQMPIMLLSYLGALKSWLWVPVFRLVRPSIWSIRVPALLGGAVIVCLFFHLLLRIHGRRAAWIGAALLATDASFLLTTCFDWGPVMLQHLLLTAAMLLGVVFWRNRRLLPLGGAFFCIGLALWDKALSLWMISGIVIALAVLYFREIRCVFTIRRAAIALAALVLGAWPFISYNYDQGLPTESNARFDASTIPHKIDLLRNTLDGAALFGYMVRDPHAPQPRRITDLAGSTSSALERIAGDHRFNWMLPAYAAALVLAFFIRRTARRAVAFCLIAFAVAWTQMLLAHGVGGSAHHTVLLWPLPQMFI